MYERASGQLTVLDNLTLTNIVIMQQPKLPPWLAMAGDANANDTYNKEQNVVVYKVFGTKKYKTYDPR